jgi:hypothetical protein
MTTKEETMKLTETGHAMLDSGEEIDPRLRLVMEVAERDIADTDDHLEALLIEIDQYFDGDLPAAIEAVRSGVITFAWERDHWRIFRC